MTTERQNQIITALVEEYIRTAEPVSSKFLAEKYDFGICPSAIRIELQSLIKDGFLEQPHISSGRIPTDKAYRFFVDNLLEEKENEEIDELVEDLKGGNGLKMASILTKFLADTSSSFTIMHLYKEGLTLKEGLDELFKEPEFNDKDFISSFAGFLENFEKNIEKIDMGSGVRVFIGKENPMPRARNITLICAQCNFPNERAVISILGPKRMDYHKNISLINSLNRALKELI